MPKSFEVLASNKTTAEFIGIEHVPCRFRTSLCPDRCNHAHEAARFKILTYEEYEKRGKYGDDKKDILQVSLSEESDAPHSDKQDSQIVEKIKSLSPGQKVKLAWEHIYVTDETNSKYPQRPIRSVECL
jgi:hypothetical protein